MAQNLSEIPLSFLNGETAQAVKTGNNAAWICPCDRDLPLLGFSDAADSTSTRAVITCPGCGRSYKVVAAKRQGVPTRVQEI
jgi:hypothetical protein